MPDNSFDIVSKIDLPEVSNAVQQAVKEIQQRFDLKDSHSSIELREKENKILLASSDEFKLKAVTDVLQAKCAAEGLELRRHHSGRRLHSAPGDHPATRHRHRKGPRHRQDHQGLKE